MFEFRITKYDPRRRNGMGHYLDDDWTSFSDVPDKVSEDEYLRVEAAYVDAALSFVRESQVDELIPHNLENSKGTHLSFIPGKPIAIEQLAQAFQDVLRERYWCIFEHPIGVFVHFGWDYYMYIGVTNPCPESQKTATASGLFVENFESPYKREKPEG